MAAGIQFVCKSRECQIVKKLFTWWVDVEAELDKKTWRWNPIGRVPKNYLWTNYRDGPYGSIRYYIDPGRDKIKETLLQVRAKSFLLDKISGLQQIKINLNNKFCNQKPITFNLYSHEKSNSVFNTH